MNYCSIFILNLSFLPFFISCIDDYITLHYFSLSRGFLVDLGIGEHELPIFFSFNMARDYSLLSEHTYKRLSMQSEKQEIVYNNQDVYADLLSLKLSLLAQCKIQNFDMYYIHEKRHELYDEIGLSYNSMEQTSSLVYQLKKNKKINRLAFGFSPEKNEEEGDVYFGDIPTQYRNNNKIELRVKSIEHKWGCDLTQIYINNEMKDKFEVDSYTYFQSNSRFIRIPQSFFTFLNTKIFMDYIVKQQCVINQIGSIKKFRCDCEITKHFPSIRFVIDDNIIELTKDNLFIFDSYNKCVFTMVNDVNDFSRHFILGVSFYRNYYTLFNYERQSIELYSTKITQKIQVTETPKEIIVNQNTKYLYIILGIFLSITSAFISIVKNKYIHN